ncbi:hypothetical protein AXK57_07640 [Tsukamurella pulmonis]|uniref:class I adenylate-forming enzyme family protein n=2 Tax=Tsukamurella pulmonis TaxID=47312 RepID=UPI00079A5105|nr:AMP-binding protein [Tsukamurella pulmonis]KXP11221.1 hypothetical protein AXK57_07640 [Tsukamurella pulmonis]
MSGLGALLAAAAARHGARIALVDGDGRMDYAQLLAAARNVAAGLRAAGVTPGDRVVLRAAPDRRSVATIYGTSLAGAVPVPLHPDATDDQLEYVAADCAAALVLRDEAALAALAASAGSADPAADGIGDSDAPALLIYTSGSTGRPKGVICPARAVDAAIAAVGAALRYRGDDVILCRLPLAFDYGLYQLLLAARVGAAVVLAAPAADIELADVLAREGVTVVPLVPELARLLVAVHGGAPGAAGVRLLTNTGARLAPELGADLLRVFPGAGIVAMYGTTECKRISVLPPEEYAAAPESVGHPIDGLRVRIDPGTSEIVVRGATLMDGYWNDDAATAHRYRRDPATGERELWTGDTGRIDADGRLYVDGRLDDVFKRRGVRVSLTEVEAAALRVPTVRAAVAARSGERLFLFVVADTPVAALGRDLAARLDPPRRPDRIVAVASIPLNPNGKADRAALVRAITAPPIDEEITA